MKHLLLTTIAAVVLVGCGESQQSVPAPEAKPVEPVAEAAKPETPSAEAPDISIHDAAKAGNIEAVKQHLAAGSNIELRCTACGGAVLGHAASGGHKEIVELLIAESADVNAKSDDGRTPLHFAATSGHKEIVELLISKGANVNEEDVSGNTPLHYAAVGGSKEVGELLIAEGADVNANGVDGVTPLDVAELGKHPETADLLRKHGGKTGKELKADGSEPNYSGIYTLEAGDKFSLSLELKPDGSFIGTPKDDEDDRGIGSWKVEGDLLVCEGTTEESSSKIIIKVNKTTFKIISINTDGFEMPLDKILPEAADGHYFKKN
jgi:hypothetical protein